MVTAAWLNSLQEEVATVIEQAGLTLDPEANNQLLTAILALIVSGGFATRLQVQGNTLVYVTDGGVANAYTAAYVPAVTALVDGMVLEYQAANSNNGAATFAPNGLPPRPIVGGAHAALQGGEIVAGGMVTQMYHAGLDSWVLQSCTGGALQVGAATQSQHAVTLAQVQALGTPAMQQYFFGQL